ncbi:MAG: hypothetical protein C5B57_01335 [Blastocatellia bacterium]|nr:MAG: hypothetical protein C5B57_01335 [Blastocatellia bacterium]
MLLNLNKIRTPHEHFEQTCPPERFDGEAELFRVIRPVVLVFDIHKDKAQFRLVGRAHTSLELACSRCLEPFTLPVEPSFDLRYQPHTANAGEGEREIEEDDLSTAFYENDTIDLGQLLREQFYLALPMKPLCGEGCLGLCPVCGTNLNRRPCECKRDWGDPRLAVLKTFKSDQH